MLNWFFFKFNYYLLKLKLNFFLISYHDITLMVVCSNIIGCDELMFRFDGLRVGGHPALSLHSSNEPGELSQ